MSFNVNQKSLNEFIDFDFAFQLKGKIKGLKIIINSKKKNLYSFLLTLTLRLSKQVMKNKIIEMMDNNGLIR